MGLIQAIVLGLIQGLTEFIPVSSSGHLFLTSFVPGWNDAGSGFTAVIQLGTIAAVLVYFWADLARILRGWAKSIGDRSLRGSPEAKMGWAVFLGTVPIAVAGLLLESKIDKDFRSATVVGSTLVGLGILLWVADRSGKQNRDLETVTWRDGLVMGLWQCLALVPGSSRSGSTITGGLFSGFDRAAAARMSFLLSVPAIVVSGLYKLVKDRDALMVDGAVSTIVATLVAFGTGYWAIGFLMKFLQTRTTLPFVIYRVVLGLIVLGLAMSGQIPNSKTTAGVQVHGLLQATQRA